MAPKTDPSVGAGVRVATNRSAGTVLGRPRARRMSWWCTNRSRSVSFGGKTRQVPAHGSRSSKSRSSSAGARPSARAMEYAFPERSDEKP